MKRLPQRCLKNKSRVLVLLSLVFILLFGCLVSPGKPSTSKEPIYSYWEHYSKTSMVRTGLHEEYFLVTLNKTDKRSLVSFVDSVANANEALSPDNLMDYVVYFYCQDKKLNPQTVSQIKYESQYRIFELNSDNFLARYYYRGRQLYTIDSLHLHP